MKEFELVNNKNIKILLTFDGEDFDYYSTVYINVVYNNQKITIYKDNLLYLKNLVDKYEDIIEYSEESIDEKYLGKQLNYYYYYLYEDVKTDELILSINGQWIGQNYSVFSTVNNATLLYKYKGDMIIKVVPIFDRFEEDNYENDFELFMEKYEDIIKEIISSKQINYCKEVILKIYQDYMR